MEKSSKTTETTQEPQEPTLGEMLLASWDSLSQLKRAQLVERMSREECASLALALGRRELEKLGCGEVPA